TYTNNADGNVEMQGFDINRDCVWIAGLTITNSGISGTSGIWVDGNYSKITSNYFYNIHGDNGAAAIHGYWYDRPTGAYIANNHIEHNLCSDFMEGFEGEATFLRRSHDIVFRNNVFFNGLPSGVGYPNGYGPIIVHDIPNVVVTNNTFYNIKYGPFWHSTTW